MEGDLGPPVGPAVNAAQVYVPPTVCGAFRVVSKLSTASRLGSSLGGVTWNTTNSSSSSEGAQGKFRRGSRGSGSHGHH